MKLCIVLKMKKDVNEKKTLLMLLDAETVI